MSTTVETAIQNNNETSTNPDGSVSPQSPNVENDNSLPQNMDSFNSITRIMSSLDSAALMTPNADMYYGLGPSMSRVSPLNLPSFDNNGIPDMNDQIPSNLVVNDDVNLMSSLQFSSNGSIGMESTGDLEIRLPSFSNDPNSPGKGTRLMPMSPGSIDHMHIPANPLSYLEPNPQNLLGADSHLPEMQWEAINFKGFEGMNEIEISLLKTCAKCLEAIKEQGVFINGQFYHNRCCNCYYCGTHLNHNSTYLFQDNLCCPNCIRVRPDAQNNPNDESFKCKSCNFPILRKGDEIIIPETGEKYHKNCISCFECGRQISVNHSGYDDEDEPNQVPNTTNLNELYKVLQGKILCNQCFEIVSDRICRVCNQPIVGDFIDQHLNYYHPEHFRCTQCNKLLKGTNFIMHHNVPYCFEHGNIFITSCTYCKGSFKLNETDKIKWNGKFYHGCCFVCRVCGTQLDPTTCKRVHGRPHCAKCFQLRLEEGEVDEHGNTLTDHQHLCEKLKNRRENYKTAHGINIIYPTYGERCCLTAEKVSKDNEALFANF